MRVLLPIKVPKVGMNVEIVKNNCCFGFQKGEGGTIMKLTGVLDFIVRDWKDQEFEHCVQCCREAKETP